MKMTIGRFWDQGAAVLVAGLALGLGACATYDGLPPAQSVSPMSPRLEAADGANPRRAAAGPEERRAEERRAEERPGLATGFGKRIRDPWHQQSFVRKSPGPAGTDVIFYNDREGVDAMSGYLRKVEPLQQAAGGLVEWGIKGGFGYLPAYKSQGRRFVVGKGGAPYSIQVKNRSRSRLEVVVSVDGLDVIDGKAAGFSKRGHVIAPGEVLEVKGWRTGWDGVARFEFSNVGESYANRRHGDARNVGVVGIAVFGEKGVDPWKWMPDEVRQRQTANPFAQAP